MKATLAKLGPSNAREAKQASVSCEAGVGGGEGGRMSKEEQARAEGAAAAHAGMSRSACPYDAQTQPILRFAWLAGHFDGPSSGPADSTVLHD